VAKVRLRGVEVDHPLEGNLRQLPVEAQADFLESIARAGAVADAPMPETFEDWIRWKLGDRIAEEYLLPYNRKIWSMDLNRLGTYWLYKLPNVSFRETLMSCLKRQAEGSLPAHGVFLYPKKTGYGEVWRRMEAALGERLRCDTPVREVDLETMTVNRAFQADWIVNTIPWTIWQQTSNLPAPVAKAMSDLVSIAVDVDYEPAAPPGNAHWIYEPDEKLGHHRILCRNNFCAGARGCWTETNSARSARARNFRHRNEFAYPINTAGKPAAVDTITEWAHSACVLPLGRWGLWERMNSDVAVSQAIAAAKDMLHKSPVQNDLRS
jgi:protoporphyrinogen oxidase